MGVDFDAMKAELRNANELLTRNEKVIAQKDEQIALKDELIPFGR
jgi:hypothetical protein